MSDIYFKILDQIEMRSDNFLIRVSILEDGSMDFFIDPGIDGDPCHGVPFPREEADRLQKLLESRPRNRKEGPQ